MKLRLISLVTAHLASACGGAPKPAQSAPESAATPAAAAGDGPPADAAGGDEAAAPAAGGMPKDCARKTGACVPPKAFVEKLCSGSYPSMAIYLFGNKSPWARGYLKGRTKAWNASGGASAD